MKPLDLTRIKLDLQTANLLIVGTKIAELDILAQMLMGFGVPGIQRQSSLEEGLRAIDSDVFDLVLIDAAMPDGAGYQLVADARRSAKDHVRHMPIILVCGHTRRSDIVKARGLKRRDPSGGGRSREKTLTPSGLR